jgi:hypothetical protein
LGFDGEKNDGRKREKERFYRGGNGGEAVIEGRDVDKNLRTDLNPSII